MKRNSFLKFFVAAATFALTPFQVIARQTKRDKKGVLVQNGADRFGKPLTLFGGDNFFCKVSASDTDGDLYIFESTRDKEGGPPLHFHYDQDEWWYILSGEFLIQVGDQTFNARAGDCVFGPRKIPHTFAKVGEGEAKLIMLFQPAGRMEEWFKMVANGTVAKMSSEEADNARRKHGFEHVGPPLTHWKKP